MLRDGTLRPSQGQRRVLMIRKVLDRIESALKIICCVVLSIIVAVLFYAVVMRYVLHRPPSWSMELGRYLFLWMVMLAAVVVTREESHIQIKFLVDMLPDRIRFVWLNLVRLLMIGFCWVMIYQGLVIYPTVAEASSPSLGISMGWLYLSVPVGGTLMGVYILECIIKSIIEHLEKGAPGEGSTC